MTRPNAELADLLAELAAMLRARRHDRFRTRAYERAGRVVRATAVDLDDMAPQEISRLDGVGEAIAAMITEYQRTGRIGLLESLRAEEPPGFGTLLRLPLIGVRDARLLAGTHGFTDVASLRAAAAKPDGLDALGERLATRVRESLRRLDVVTDAGMPLPAARRQAATLAASIGAIDDVDDVIVAGAVRRAVDIVESFDLVVITRGPQDVSDAVAGDAAVVRVLERTANAVHVVTPVGLPARLWTAQPDDAGAALLHATGAAPHVEQVRQAAAERGLALRTDGLFDGERRVVCRDEAALYRAVGLAAVPPQLREGRGEVAAAAAGRLPCLVDLDDVRGDLHVHSDWSGDGRDTLDAMVRAAAGRGYAYVAVSDHAENLSINGMSRDEVRRRRAAIADVRQRHPDIRVLDAAELNIGLDGDLDYDEDFLAQFDLGVASVHSHMDRDRARQTDRILAAITRPSVHVIGHLTGRIIGHRPGYEVELHAIAQAAAETGTALEVNGSPRRLDISGEMVRIAVDAGARIAVSSDAHNVAELSYVDDAVATARRGWVTADAVVNCLDAGAFAAWTSAGRGRS